MMQTVSDALTVYGRTMNWALDAVTHVRYMGEMTVVDKKLRLLIGNCDMAG